MNESRRHQPLSEATLAGYRLLRERCGWAAHPSARAVELTGEDRKGWLQGQITNDLRALQPGGSMSFCLCSATGQLEAICRLWSLDDRLLVLGEQQAIQVLLRRIERMVILEDVHARPLDGSIVSVEGPEATRELGRIVELPLLEAHDAELEGERLPWLRMNRTGFGGWATVLPNTDSKASSRLRTTFEQVNEEALEIARIEAGIPRFGVDTNSRTLPPELGASFEAAHISYNKGCYLGQEVLMRLHSRGHTNRTWMGVVSEGPLAAGDSISHLGRDDAGVVTSACESPEFGYIGAAYVRRESAFRGETVTVRTPEGDWEAEIQDMPLLRLV